MKSIKNSSFSTGFRFFLNLSGFISGGLVCFISGAVFSSKQSLDFSDYGLVCLRPLIIFFLIVSSFFLFFRIKTSHAYRRGMLPFVLDASGVNRIFSELMDSFDFGICVSDRKDGRPLFINRKLKDMFECCFDDEGQGWMGDIKNPPSFLKFLSSERLEGCSGSEVCGWEGRSGLNDRWYSTRVRNIRWIDGSTCVLQTVYDINSLKKRETGIREFTRGIMKARENELKNISTDLHDQVAQDLASLRIALDTVYYGVDLIPEKLVERTRNMSIVLQDAISHLREIAYGLTPSALDDFGVEKALQQCCNEFSEKHGIHVSCLCSGTHRITSDCELYINLYRIVQETLERFGNFTKPAHIRLGLVFSSSRIIVKLESDGKGYDLSTSSGFVLAEDELGLSGIRERVRLIGGEGFRINSGDSIGVVIYFEIPGNYGQITDGNSVSVSSAAGRSLFETLAAESRPYKTNAAKKFLLFCKDDKNDLELRPPDQYQSHVRWRR